MPKKKIQIPPKTVVRLAELQEEKRLLEKFQTLWIHLVKKGFINCRSDDWCTYLVCEGFEIRLQDVNERLVLDWEQQHFTLPLEEFAEWKKCVSQEVCRSMTPATLLSGLMTLQKKESFFTLLFCGHLVYYHYLYTLYYLKQLFLHRSVNQNSTDEAMCEKRWYEQAHAAFKLHQKYLEKLRKIVEEKSNFGSQILLSKEEKKAVEIAKDIVWDFWYAAEKYGHEQALNYFGAKYEKEADAQKKEVAQLTQSMSALDLKQSVNPIAAQASDKKNKKKKYKKKEREKKVDINANAEEQQSAIVFPSNLDNDAIPVGGTNILEAPKQLDLSQYSCLGSISLPGGAMQTIFEAIESSGYIVFIRGGFPRDILWNIAPKDIDFFTNCPEERLSSILVSFELKFGGLPGLWNCVPLERSTDNPRMQIQCVSDIESLLKTADLTLNAIFCNSEGKVFIYPEWQLDFKDKALRVIEVDGKFSSKVLLRAFWFYFRFEKIGLAFAERQEQRLHAQLESVAGTLPYVIYKGYIRKIFTAALEPAIAYFNKAQLLFCFISKNVRGVYLNTQEQADLVNTLRQICMEKERNTDFAEEVLFFLLTFFIKKCEKFKNFDTAVEQFAANFFLEDRALIMQRLDYLNKRVSSVPCYCPGYLNSLNSPFPSPVYSKVEIAFKQ